MASNYTKNYGLCQWEATDQVRREEFNQDNTKMDETLKTLADKDIALESAVAAVAAAAGNCQMELFTYTGTGTYGEGKAKKITFTTKPDIYMIAGYNTLLLGMGGNKKPLMIAEDAISGTFLDETDITWNGNSFSIINYVSAQYQLNTKDKLYWVMGLTQKGI